jgi:hypothetical protein
VSVSRLAPTALCLWRRPRRTCPAIFAEFYRSIPARLRAAANGKAADLALDDIEFDADSRVR